MIHSRLKMVTTEYCYGGVYRVLYLLTMSILMVISYHHNMVQYRRSCISGNIVVNSFVLMIPQQHRTVRLDKTNIGNHRLVGAFIPFKSLPGLGLQPNTMIEYTGEGQWDTAFIQEQRSFVPPVQIVTKMPERLLPSSSNMNYYLLRHGQSTANVAEIISSDRMTLSYTEKHGLTELGFQQATAAAQSLLQQIQKDHMMTTMDPQRQQQHRLIFVSSPFARARQTALACLQGVQELIQQQQQPQLEVVPSIFIHNLLVERSFGDYDNDILETYGYVWPLDQINVTHTTYNVESVAAVATRIQSLIYKLNTDIAALLDSNNVMTTTNHHIVLVSHGDVLQIAQLYSANVTNVGEFSSYRFQSKFVGY